jgi:DNA-binding transcriptional ArsR family regulator
MGPRNPKEYNDPTYISVVDLGAVLASKLTMKPNLDTLFSALADRTRRQILAMLLEDDMAVTDVAEPFDISLAAISKHLVILSKAGLISQERRGRVNWCKLEPSAMRDVTIWIESFGQFEAVNLDAFERFLDFDLETGPEDTGPADAGAKDAK